MAVTALRCLGSTAVIALLALCGCGEEPAPPDASGPDGPGKSNDRPARNKPEKSRSSPIASKEPAAPKGDYADWVWIYTKDRNYRFAVPPGAWNYLDLDMKPLKSTVQKPYVTGGLLRIVMPGGEHLMFQTAKSSKDLGDRFDREFVRGSLYGPLGAQSVSQARMIEHGVGTTAEFVARCRNSPFLSQEGKSFTAVVRIVQTGGTDIIFTIVSRDAKYDEKRIQQILDSFQRVSDARVSPAHGAKSP